MSGLEIVAVVGVISNIVSVINFCSRVVDETIDARRRTRDVPKAYESLKAILPLVQLTLTKTLSRIEAGEIDKATVEPLQPLIRQCGLKIDDLASIFRQMQHEQNPSRFRMFFKSAKNLTQDKKVNTLAESILRDHLLICQHGAAPINPEDIDGIVNKVGVKLDSHIDQLISELKTSQSVPASLSLGSANATNQSFQSSSTNVTVNGATHIYNVNLVNAQMVDVMKTEYGPVPRVVEGLPHKAIEADTPSTYPLIQKTSVPAVAAVQFESPHLSGIKHTSPVPALDLLDTPRNASTSTNYSSRLPLPHEPLEILHVALVEIREASAGTIDYPGIAKERYKKALKTVDLVTEQLANGNPKILLRKIRLQTIACIGLSQVEIPSTKHLKKAQQYNDEAFALISRSSNTNENNTLLARAKLDKAHLRQREARIDERSGMTSKSKVRSLRTEAFELYLQAAAEVKKGSCSTMDDFEVLANALVGCGRISKKLGGGEGAGRRFSAGFGGPARQKSIGGAEGYFREAVAAVEEGLKVGLGMGEREDDREALRGVGEGARKAMSAGSGGGE